MGRVASTILVLAGPPVSENLYSTGPHVRHIDAGEPEAVIYLNCDLFSNDVFKFDLAHVDQRVGEFGH